MTVTPSPQSVVVPVEPTGAMILAGAEVKGMVDVYGCVGNPDEVWSAMLAAAPALRERLSLSRLMYPDTILVHPEDVETILAALSPEAPAREGVDDHISNAGKKVGPASFPPCSEIDLINHSLKAVRVLRTMLAARDLDAGVKVSDGLIADLEEALTPRHEAPADPCASHRSMGFHIDPCCPHCEAPAEGSGEALLQQWVDAFEGLGSGSGPLINSTRAYLARARSSAPEAREDALGNLLAVIHGDGGHRALEVGTKQAALEAEKIVAGLFAAPSADKLRIAVEALGEWLTAAAQDYGSPDGEADDCPVATYMDGSERSATTFGHLRRAAEALAALKAGAAK